ncbi:MAG: hypothetical protein JWO52_6707 [Gammaproteobacteria bacterium]|jgi:hypothetical protein|nr:hypothetical protein [Gammaproteobacteria bacterium]
MNGLMRLGRMLAIVLCVCIVVACGGGGESPAPAPLTLSAATSVDANTTRTVQASGGTSPYTYSVLSGGGSINSTSGVFSAPSAAGTMVIQVRDAQGKTAQQSLEVNPPLTAIPSALTIGGGASQQINVMGGQGPFTYNIVSGDGTVNVSGLYTAPAKSGAAVVRVTDALGTSVDMALTINPPLTSNPASATLTASSGQSLQFLGKDGIAPYTYSLASGPGSLTAEGVYTVGSASGTASVRITDAQGTVVTANVRVLRIRLNGLVAASATDGTSIYVGGRFSAANPYSAPHLLMVDQDNGDPVMGCDLGTGFLDGPVNAVVTSGNTIYVAGQFNFYNGTIVGKLAKIDATTCALDTNFTRAGGFGTDPGFSVDALVVSGHSLFVGGNFISYRGNAVNSLVKIDALSGDRDPTFNSGTGPDIVAGIAALAASDSALYVGGSFSHFKGTVAPNIAKLDLATGAADTTFAQAPGPDDAILKLVVSGTDVYAAGPFLHYGAVATSFAKLDAASGVVNTAFSQNVAGYTHVNTILPAGQSVYFGRETYGGSKIGLVKVNAATGVTDSAFTKTDGFDFGVRALALAGSSLYVGGAFTTYQGYSAYNLAKVDATTGVLDRLFTHATGGNSSVGALALVGSTVIAGGPISTYGGQPIRNIAKFSVATGELDPVFARSSGPDLNVLALALDGGSLYVGGIFQHYQSLAVNRLAKVDAHSGALDTTFAQAGGLDFRVSSLLVSGGALYAGAIQVEGTRGLAKIDLVTGASDPTFTSAGITAGTVNTLAAFGSALYVGGDFQTYGGLPAQNLAKVDLATGVLDTSFTQASGIGTAGQFVSTLLVSGTKLFVGGNFTTYRGVAGPGLIKVDAASGAPDATFKNAAGPAPVVIQGLATDGKSLYVSGFFSTPVSPLTADVIKLDLATGDLDSAFYDPNSICATCGVNLDSLILIGAQLYVGADGSTLYRGTPAHFAFPLDTTTGALVDP